ncbi:hypothetical protein FB451DRAFT_1168719 [Mycena latifolia]|nr:hypothetical protein FB451DRAFT_1168719 [Mycena latifolia]
MARQGHSFATAQNVRGVHPPKDSGDTVLVDVPGTPKRPRHEGGSFSTGDLAIMHPDGAIVVVDRSKDIIISGGEVLYSIIAIEQDQDSLSPRARMQIEMFTELSAHPDVREVSIVSRNHIKWGERPHAFVMLKSHATTKWQGRHEAFSDELKTYAKSRLPGFARPNWVQVVQELPKTSTGKIIFGRLLQSCSLEEQKEKADEARGYSNRTFQLQHALYQLS